AHGTDRVLFATDSPWADGADYLEFIRSSGLGRDELDRILGSNAEELLMLAALAS
ncbi:MAG: amidohydrolase family protein, partial [Clostridia bacterium]|nr:amidohydrolase family protein [Clostridia bacterium]